MFSNETLSRNYSVKEALFSSLTCESSTDNKKSVRDRRCRVLAFRLGEAVLAQCARFDNFFKGFCGTPRTHFPLYEHLHAVCVFCEVENGK